MGNCVGTNKADKPGAVKSPTKTRSVDIIDETHGPIVNVESTKKQYNEDFREEEKKQVNEVRLLIYSSS